MPARIVVLGSINMDLVTRAPVLPQRGETLLGGSFEVHPGGKGANQAVAAARLGAEVTMVGCVGDDDHGRTLVARLRGEGIDTMLVRTIPGVATGVALITVDETTGENTIVVAPGANALVAAPEVEAAMEAIASADAILMQLEVAIEAVRALLARAERFRALTILNAAPARRLDVDLRECLDVLIVNESEARTLAGAHRTLSAPEVAALLPLGRQALGVVTLGDRGALTVVQNDHIAEHPAFAVTAVDTTAAGDAFCGALAVRLAELGVTAGPSDEQLADAVCFASAAGALACTRRGAQPSLPRRSEVAEFLRTHPYRADHRAFDSYPCEDLRPAP